MKTAVNNKYVCDKCIKETTKLFYELDGKEKLCESCFEEMDGELNN